MNPETIPLKRRKRRFYWTKERIAEVASQYDSRVEFRRKNLSAYSAARRLGIDAEVCAHMNYIKRRAWDIAAIIANARLYSSRKEWRAANSGAHWAAWNLGILPMCLHEGKET